MDLMLHQKVKQKKERLLVFSTNKRLPEIKAFQSFEIYDKKPSNIGLYKVSNLMCLLHEINSCLTIIGENERYAIHLTTPGPIMNLKNLLDRMFVEVQEDMNEAIEADQRKTNWKYINLAIPALTETQSLLDSGLTHHCSSTGTHRSRLTDGLPLLYFDPLSPVKDTVGIIVSNSKQISYKKMTENYMKKCEALCIF